MSEHVERNKYGHKVFCWCATYQNHDFCQHTYPCTVSGAGVSTRYQADLREPWPDWRERISEAAQQRGRGYTQATRIDGGGDELVGH